MWRSGPNNGDGKAIPGGIKVFALWNTVARVQIERFLSSIIGSKFLNGKNNAKPWNIFTVAPMNQLVSALEGIMDLENWSTDDIPELL